MPGLAQNKSSVARRLATRIVVVGFALSCLALAVMLPFERTVAQRESAAEARVLSEAVAAMYMTVDRTSEMEQASRLLLRVARVPHVEFVNVLDRHGVVLYSTDTAQIGRQVSFRHGTHVGDGVLTVTHMVSSQKTPIGAVSVAMNLSSVFYDMQRFYLQLGIIFCLIILFLGMVVAAMTERLVGSRLSRIITCMESAEQGSFLVRAKVDRMDEIGAVAVGFNKLLAAITNLQVKDIEREQDLQVVQKQLTIKEQLEQAADELRSSNKSLERRVKAQELLMDAAHQLGGTLSKDVLVSRLVTLVRDKLGWPDFAIFLVDEKPKEGEQQQQLRLAIASGMPNIDIIRQLTFRLGEGITGLVAKTGAPIIVDDLASEKRIKLMDSIDNPMDMPNFLREGSMLSVPMIYQGRVVGVMDFFCPEKGAFDEEDTLLLHALGAQAAMAIVNADLYEATLELAISDPLTGLMNRRAMKRRIESEIARTQRFSTPLSLLMVDVDHFKVYNDRMGHVIGDGALKMIAQKLRTAVRKVDGVARFGGEEFCVILPQTSQTAAKEVAQKLCDLVRTLDIQGADGQPLGHISVSIGVAVYPDDMPPLLEMSAPLELVAAADDALYAAKRNGRDCVVTYKGQGNGDRGSGTRG